METVQLALGNPAYRTALEAALFECGSWQVVSVVTPDPARSGVIVLDAPALEQWQGLLAGPERVVLITPKDPQSLERAWEAGIISVVFDDDPISTAMLAVMSAGLRVHQRSGSHELAGEAPRRESDARCGYRCACHKPRGEEVH